MPGTTVTATGAVAQLNASDVTAVIGTVVNPAGLTLAKTVPLRRAAAFADPGLGASPVWHGFTIDQAGIAFGDGISVVGDQRIRIDMAALHTIGDGFAWAPGNFTEQDGSPVAACSRGTLGRVEQRLADAGLAARVGHEIEFVLVGPDGSRLPASLWAQYGLAGVLEHEDFVRDVIVSAADAGVSIEQFHPEYGLNQFEMSLSPLTPTASADHLVLARIVIARVARRHGLRVSFSPVPFADGVGSGAHQHFSLTRGDRPLLSGGDGAHGMTTEGEAAVAGVVRGLGEAQAVLSGSIVSVLRMKPGMWSGAWTCWGTENREAAVRFVAGGDANPHGANVEVKCIDGSANPYFASAAILGLALDGIENGAPLPPEMSADPGTLSDAERADAGVAALPTAQPDVVAALDGSARLRRVLGDDAVNAVAGVRRYEHENFGDLEPAALADKFRMAWSL